jgi:hypothetical protein
MKKFLLTLLVSLFLCLTPAFAQHGHAGGGGGYHGGGFHAAPAQHSNPSRGEAHGAYQRGGVQGEHNDHGVARGFYRGGRFDHEFFGSHWGYGHRFWIGNCVWYGGPRWAVGSYFWFNGGYWAIVDPIDPLWYDDEVYVDWVDGYGYVLVNPYHPGVYFRVGVRF